MHPTLPCSCLCCSVDIAPRIPFLFIQSPIKSSWKKRHHNKQRGGRKETHVDGTEPGSDSTNYSKGPSDAEAEDGDCEQSNVVREFKPSALLLSFLLPHWHSSACSAATTLTCSQPQTLACPNENSSLPVAHPAASPSSVAGKMAPCGSQVVLTPAAQMCSSFCTSTALKIPKTK